MPRPVSSAAASSAVDHPIGGVIEGLVGRQRRRFLFRRRRFGQGVIVVVAFVSRHFARRRHLFQRRRFARRRASSIAGGAQRFRATDLLPHGGRGGASVIHAGLTAAAAFAGFAVEIAGAIERSVGIEGRRRRQVHGVRPTRFLRARRHFALAAGALEQRAGTDEAFERRSAVGAGFRVGTRHDTK